MSLIPRSLGAKPRRDDGCRGKRSEGRRATPFQIHHSFASGRNTNPEVICPPRRASSIAAHWPTSRRCSSCTGGIISVATGLSPTSSPPAQSVLDVCCGPAHLYHRYLKAKSVQYCGLDINERFIRRLTKSGAEGRLYDVAGGEPFPPADYVIMQASLYHFLPAAGPVVDRMLRAARRQVIVAEPIRNLADSRVPLLAWFARRQTDPGLGPQPHRFTEETLDGCSRHTGRAWSGRSSSPAAGRRCTSSTRPAATNLARHLRSFARQAARSRPSWRFPSIPRPRRSTCARRRDACRSSSDKCGPSTPR